MSKQLTGLASLLLSAVALVAAAPAPAVASSGAALRARPVLAFGLRGIGRRPGFATRSRYSRPSYRYGYRRSPFHGLGGTILKGLGIAYLFHAVFGWGAGG